MLKRLAGRRRCSIDGHYYPLGMAAQAGARRWRRLGVHRLNFPGVFLPSSIRERHRLTGAVELLLRIFLTLTITWASRAITWASRRSARPQAREGSILRPATACMAGSI